MGWCPTAAQTAGWDSAMAIAPRLAAMSAPIAISPVTPAATASSTADGQSGTSSRWRWVSTKPRPLVAGGLHAAQLLVDHRVVQLLEARPPEWLADRVEPRLHRGQQAAVALAELARRRHGAEILVRVDQRAVHQVAPGPHQLVVVAAHELRPREVRVLRLRPRDREVEAQRVGVVAGQEVAHVDDDVARRGE